MDMLFWRFDLKLTHTWTIASQLGPGGGGGMDDFPVVLLELRDGHGVTGLGEAAPSTRYDENPETVLEFLNKVDASRLSFDDLPASMAYLNSIAPGHYAPKGALNIALLDGAARKAGKPIYDFLKLGFRETSHPTSFSIGIDNPDTVRRKVLAAAQYPILKLKVGNPNDVPNLSALREVAPSKTVRVDANEAWKTKEEALRRIEALAATGPIEFIEQPIPNTTNPKDIAWLKSRSPIPIFADESCLSVSDVPLCADCFHGVNVKLVKAGGITGAFDTLQAARRAGLKTMIGCMIETSVLISAGAHLAELADHLDLDGNILCSNDPYEGVTAEQGMMSFAKAKETVGLRVKSRH